MRVSRLVSGGELSLWPSRSGPGPRLTLTLPKCTPTLKCTHTPTTATPRCTSRTPRFGRSPSSTREVRSSPRSTLPTRRSSGCATTTASSTTAPTSCTGARRWRRRSRRSSSPSERSTRATATTSETITPTVYPPQSVEYGERKATASPPHSGAHDTPTLRCTNYNALGIPRFGRVLPPDKLAKLTAALHD